MPDEADRGNDTAELFLKAALQNVKRPMAACGAGFCINCGEDLGGDERWCDKDCMADWEARQRNQRR